jgi:CheY-like chemotaxis protein
MASNAAILVVDDSQDDAELITRAFRRAGFDNPLHTVGHTAEALEYLKGQGRYADRGRFPLPRLMLLDHAMPGDGYQLLEWVRHQGNLRRLAVVVFSGSENPDHEKTARDLGANAYHIKPQDFAGLTQTIRRIGEFWLMSIAPESR